MRAHQNTITRTKLRPKIHIQSIIVSQHLTGKPPQPNQVQGSKSVEINLIHPPSQLKLMISSFQYLFLFPFAVLIFILHVLIS
jgi:hypothetical protein